MSTCSRSGCTKYLRASNTKGVCASGCLSPEAPASLRAKGITVKASAPVESLEAGHDIRYVETQQSTPVDRFRTVAHALGLDPDTILNEFAQAWLDGLKAKLTEE